MRIISFTVAWLAGVWIASLLDIAILLWFAATLGFFLAAVTLYHYQKSKTGLSFIHFGIFCLAASYYMWALPTIDEQHVAFYNEQTAVIITGLVIDEPDIRDQSIFLRLKAESIIRGGGERQPIEGLVLVRVPRFPVIPYGAQLQIVGDLETPVSSPNFDYKSYLARQGIHSLMSWPQMTVLAENQGSLLYHAIFAFKARAQGTIQQLLPDPQAALLTGILLGNDQGLPRETAEQFRTTGMTHIIAISGFNIAILVGTLMRIGRPILGRRWASYLALTAVSLYTLLVGADAAVVRAAIMGSLFIFSRQMMGRPTFAPASLFVAALIMKLFDPFILWDIGFQLSFAATLGLMLYVDPLSEWTQTRLRSLVGSEATKQLMRFISEGVLVTLAAQILTLPLMVGYFGQISFVSFAANLFILPAQAGVMIWGALATLVGLISPVIGQPLAWIAWLFLTYTVELVQFFAAVPGAAAPINVSPITIVAIYIAIFAVTWIVLRRPAAPRVLIARLQAEFPRVTALGVGGLVALLFLIWGLNQPDGNLHVAFLDVGQGDAIFIQTPSGRQIVVDGGRYPSVLYQQLGQQMPFWDRKIDMVIATHPEADHISGLPGLFDRYEIGQLLTNGEIKETAVSEALNTAATNQGVTIRPVSAGEIIIIEDGVQLEVLNPPGLLAFQNSNQNSVAVRLTYADISILLTGDVEILAERAMIQSGRPLQSTVLKAGHHGSNTSSTMAFLNVVQPQIAVISSGQDNRFGHPHPEVLQRLAQVGAAVLRTDQLGTIELISDGQMMWWQAEREKLDIRN